MDDARGVAAFNIALSLGKAIGKKRRGLAAGG
jgi:hypothetical protein